MPRWGILQEEPPPAESASPEATAPCQETAARVGARCWRSAAASGMGLQTGFAGMAKAPVERACWPVAAALLFGEAGLCCGRPAGR